MLIAVKVKTGQKRAFIEVKDGQVIVSLVARPQDGKANQELIKLLAEKFDIPKSSIFIKAGTKSKLKLVEIDIEEERVAHLMRQNGA